MPLVQLSAGFQSLPRLPTIILGPSGADSLVDGFVYVLDPVTLSNELSCESGSFCLLNTHRFFQSEVLRLYFPTGTLGCLVCLAPQLFLPVYPHQVWDCLGPPAAASPSLPATA